MAHKIVYQPRQQVKFEQLQSEIDGLLREMMALKQQQNLNIDTNLLDLTPKSLVFAQA